MLIDALRNFPKQFSWEPKVVNENYLLRKADNFIVAGMGGSHLFADLVKACLPRLPIIVHKNYGLPDMPAETLKKSFVIASSYSGNTEEALDAFETALANGLAVAAITTGGKLLELAQKNNVPYVQMPAEHAEPRFSLGYSFRALLRLLDETSTLGQSDHLADNLKTESAEMRGKELAQKLQNKIPIIYSSARYFPASYVWKIKFNETSKIPAFCNEFPELNHNEMTGFDTKEKTVPLMEKFHFVFLKDPDDDPHILKRMEMTRNLLEKQELKVEVFTLEGESQMRKIFDSLMVADFASYSLAEFYSNDPEQVPMVEEFKKMIA